MVEFLNFQHFGPQKCTFGPQNGLLGPRRKTLYKHKVLGGVLEAEDRKSAFLPEKSGIPSKIRNSTEIRGIPKLHGNPPEFTKRLYFCFKKLSRLCDFVNSGTIYPQNTRIWWNSPNLVEFLEIWWNFRNSAEFPPFCGKTRFGRKWPKIPIKYHWNYNTFQRRRKTGSVFAQMQNSWIFCKNHEISRILAFW